MKHKKKGAELVTLQAGGKKEGGGEAPLSPTSFPPPLL